MAETRTARIELNEHGVVSVRIYDGAQQSLADAKENLATAVSATEGPRPPLLIATRRAKPLDAAARLLFSDETEAAEWLNGHRT